MPHAIESTVDLMRSTGLDLISPYPRQIAQTTAERLIQPLLQWSWLTFLPLRLAETSPRPSLSAANGQLLAVRRSAYDKAGGHQAVAMEIIEDVALLRAVKRAGGRGVVVDGTSLASCRMYTGTTEIVDGYEKSLRAAFGSPAGAVAVTAALAGMYVLPAVAALGRQPRWPDRLSRRRRRSGGHRPRHRRPSLAGYPRPSGLDRRTGRADREFLA
ncbi:glycosyltransferase [Fodinicola feengrottensis]|uniref:glycosyltransferase n=1 Tax=Fodinicola feengrottensis TaxID=435914 RepID=UPI002441BD78|nr:glycosyltransferase [Fodinicola feengrottensis]